LYFPPGTSQPILLLTRLTAPSGLPDKAGLDLLYIFLEIFILVQMQAQTRPFLYEA
jgi:hypothetical protein